MAFTQRQSEPSPERRRGPVTASDLAKELEERYRDDPEYRSAVDAQEAEHRARHEALMEAERPLVLDLQAAGIPADSAWDLHKHPEMGEAAFPILLAHLRGDYPDRILEGIARAFTKEVTRRHWQELLDFYLAETRERVRDGLAATLSGAAARTHYADLVAILDNSGLGETRIYFLRPVNRIGNRMEVGSGRKVIEHYEHDPQLGTEAARILKGRGRNY